MTGTYNFPQGMRTIPAFIQTPTLTPTDADLDKNETFRTGLATSLSPNVALFIHRIIENITPKDVLPAGTVDNIVYVLSENVGATSASALLTDPRTLFIGGRTYTYRFTTSGASQAQEALIRYLDLPVPIITIAQQLNLLGEIVEQAAVASPNFDIWLRLEYTLQAVDASLMQALIQRLNLSPQP